MMNSLKRAARFDPEVVDFARRTDPQQAARSKQWIQKRALAQFYLPNRQSPEKGFGVPIGNWFIATVLALASGRHQRCFGDYFNRMLREHREGKTDHRMYLWNAWLLNQWLAK
jgi:asparagine synthase (glutamine-hydrolysing)